MHPTVYTTIKENVSVEIDKIEGSRFIGQLFFLHTQEETEIYLTACHKQFPTANHHCFARTFGVQHAYTHKSSDDGEPSGTAGKPILFVLEGKKLHNVLCVVSRIFGGTKLGKGGLVRAYTQAAQAAVAQAQCIEVPIEESFAAEYSYEDVATVRYLCERNYAHIIDEIYEDLIAAKISVNVAFAKTLQEKLTEKKITWKLF